MRSYLLRSHSAAWIVAFAMLLLSSDSYGRQFITKSSEKSGSAEIVSYTVPTGLAQRGDTYESTVQIRNTAYGQPARTYWIGLSFAHEDAGEWPVLWYDVKPYETSVLDPGEEEELVMDFTVPLELRPGQYSASLAIWEGFDEDQWLMIGPRLDE